MTTFLQPGELDKLLRYPRGRSARLARKGLIPCTRLPDGELRFDRELIDDWLKRGCPVPAAPEVNP